MDIFLHYTTEEGQKSIASLSFFGKYGITGLQSRYYFGKLG